MIKNNSVFISFSCQLFCPLLKYIQDIKYLVTTKVYSIIFKKVSQFFSFLKNLPEL